jgi:hypothetical protein
MRQFCDTFYAKHRQIIMAHKIRWHLDKRILLIDYVGDIDLAEVHQINDELESFRLEGHKPVHIISDHSRMGKTALTLNLTFKSFPTMKKYGWGWVVLLGIGQPTRFFADVFAMQFRLKMKIATNYEEAFMLLRQRDATLH